MVLRPLPAHERVALPARPPAEPEEPSQELAARLLAALSMRATEPDPQGSRLHRVLPALVLPFLLIFSPQTAHLTTFIPSS